jgi:hypothetical protein
MLMDAIRAESRKGPINLVDYYNWVTSDGKRPPTPSTFHPLFNRIPNNKNTVLGELAFSESFGSVANRKTNSWIATLFDTVKFGAYDSAIHRHNRGGNQPRDPIQSQAACSDGEER